MLDSDGQEISQILEESLKAILTGQASLGDILRQHPHLASTLQPEIEAALWVLAREQQVSARPGFISASRKRVVDQIRQESQNRGTRRAFPSFLLPRSLSAFQWVVAILFLIVFITGVGGVLSISQDALPGDPLYSVKRVTEEVAVGLTLSDIRKVDLRAEFVERRMEEVETLIEKENYPQAAEALNELEQGITQVVVLLQESSDGKPAQKRALASQVQSDMTRFAQRLDALKLNAPDSFRANLERARDASMNGASIATSVYEQIPQEKSATDAPGQVEPGMAETVQPGGPVRPQNDPEANGSRFSKTPKPTNENQPEKEPKPTKEPKPPKEDESTDLLTPAVEEEPTDPLKPTKEEKSSDKDS